MQRQLYHHTRNQVWDAVWTAYCGPDTYEVWLIKTNVIHGVVARDQLREEFKHDQTSR